MKEIVNRLHENRQIELAKSILEAHGYEIKLKESGYTLIPDFSEVVYSGAEVLGGLGGPETEALADAVKTASEMLGTDTYDMRCINHNESDSVDFSEISKLPVQDKKEIEKNDYHVVLSLVKDSAGLMIVFEENLYAPEGYGEPDYNIYFSYSQYQEIYSKTYDFIFKPTNDTVGKDLSGRLSDIVNKTKGITHKEVKKLAGNYHISIECTPDMLHRAAIVIENCGFFSSWVKKGN